MRDDHTKNNLLLICDYPKVGLLLSEIPPFPVLCTNQTSQIPDSIEGQLMDAVDEIIRSKLSAKGFLVRIQLVFAYTCRLLLTKQ